MERDVFMDKARNEIDQIITSRENAIMSIIEQAWEQAWEEGKRNAELDEITEIVKKALDRAQPSYPVMPTYPDPVSPWINPTITCDTTAGKPPEAHFADEEDKPHKVSMVVCLNCGKRWVAVRPLGTKLTDLDCPQCRTQGAAIETGEELEDDGK